MSEKVMTLEEVARQMERVESCCIPGSAMCVGTLGIEWENWLTAVRAHRCEPDRAEWVRVSEVREVFNYTDRMCPPCNGLLGRIEAILPKPPKRDPLEELERGIESASVELPYEKRLPKWLALLREARAAK